MNLRPYQQQALDEIRSHYAKGTKKVLLHLATGGGKTLIFCNVLKGVKERGKKAMMVVRGKKLVDQASKRLDREGVDHGVIMSGHWRNRPNLSIQVCSIDTLYARRNKLDLPEFDLIVIDEAHFAGSPSFLWLIKKYDGTFFLPVTATPHLKKGLRHVADKVVYPITIKELIESGYLVPPEYYAPSKPNLDGVHVDRKTGDYNLDELADAMQKTNLYGDMVGSYQKFANGLPAILFCVSVKHSKEVCQAFNLVDIRTEHIDAEMPDDERNTIISRLESGETKIICNVGIFTTGVDIPALKCIILARPTKSYNLYIQILGRGTRTHPGKTKFIVLDHADAVSEHGFIEHERLCNLEGMPEGEKRASLVTCEVCFHIFDPVQPDGKRDYVCKGILDGQVCGHDNRKQRDADEASERKVEIDESYELKKIEVVEAKSELDNDIIKRIEDLCFVAISSGSKKPAGRVYHQLKVDPRYGSKVANQYFQKITQIVFKIEKGIHGSYQKQGY